MGLFFLAFYYYQFILPPARYRAAEFRGLLVSQLDTYNCYMYFVTLLRPYSELSDVIQVDSPAGV